MRTNEAPPENVELRAALLEQRRLCSALRDQSLELELITTEHAELAARLEARDQELAVAQGQLEEFSRRLVIRDEEVTAARRRLERSIKGRDDRLHAGHVKRRELERELSALRQRAEDLAAENERFQEERAEVAADLRRVRATRSWRIGHALTRTMRVLTFRRPGRDSALDHALKRLG